MTGRSTTAGTGMPGATTSQSPAPASRKLPGARDVAMWRCENCANDTPSHRRRCSDCRTSRY